jgi:hypothetical protein
MKIMMMVTLPAHLNTLHPHHLLHPHLDHFRLHQEEEEMNGGVITVVGEEMMIENVGIIGTAIAAVHHQLTMKIEGWVRRREIHHHHVTTTTIAIKTAAVGQVVEEVTVEEMTVTIEEGTEVTDDEEEVMTKGSNNTIIISHQNKIIRTTVMDGKGKSVSNVDQHPQDHLEMIPSDTSRVEREPLLGMIIVSFVMLA